MPKRYLWWLILFLLPVSLSYAQTSDSTGAGAIFTYTSGEDASFINFPEASWLPDSQSFTFGIFSSDDYRRPRIFQYFLATNEMQTMDTSPLQSALSLQQQETFGAVNWPSVAPDGNMIIYPINDQVCGEGGCSNVLALGNLKTGQHTTIHKPVDTRNYIHWSADSSAFLIMDFGQYGGVGGIWYGKVPPDMADSIPIEPILLANYGTGDIGFVDISPDGERVLVRDPGDGGARGLRLWDSRAAASPQQFVAFADGKLILGSDVVVGASFVPDDEQHLMVVAKEGIIRYDLETDTFEVINPLINAQTSSWTYFSPDVQYALVYIRSLDDVSGQQIKLIQLKGD